MEFIQTYAKEIFSLLVPIVTIFLNHQFKAKARLQHAKPHKFTFLVDVPLTNQDGDVISPTQGVHTVTHVIGNSGKETATNVELVFNWKPLCINIWPLRHYEEHTEKDGRYVLIFGSLAPNEHIGLELLSINKELPEMITSRSDQCTATTIAMYPQPIAPTWKRRVGVTLLFFGLSFVVYLSILLLQFLIVNSPYGH